MVQFKEEEVKAMLAALSEIPAKFSIHLIQFLDKKLSDYQKELEPKIEEIKKEVQE